MIKDATGSYPLSLMPLAVISAAGCAMVVALGRGAAKGAAQGAGAESEAAVTTR